MRRIGTVLVACALLCACTSVHYANDVAVDALMERVRQTDDGNAYFCVDEDVYTFYFGEQVAYAQVDDRCIIKHEQSTNVSEIGIFHVASSDGVEEVKCMAQEYIQKQTAYLRSFAANYQPEELSRIDGADVVVVGNYVVFYIADKTQANKALRTIKAALLL